MEEKNKNDKNHDKNKPQVVHRGYKTILECFAFFGVACVAIALLIATCFQGSNAVYNAFKTIGDCIAYILAIILAGYYVKKQKHIAWLICYVVFVVLIVVLYILGAVKAF